MELLSFKEAAALLGVSAVSVKRWTLAGYLPVVRLSKRLVRIPLDKLKAFIDAGGITASEKQAG